MSSYNRVEGQLWIDRNSPYRLKYFVKGEEYEVSVSQNYEGKSNTFYPGNVVKIGYDDRLAKAVLEKAVFPRDIDRVIGVISSPSNEDSGETQRFSVSELDNIFIKKGDLESVFVEGDITSKTSNPDYPNKEDLIGAPVYWFIGLTEPSEPSGYSYTYKDSSEYPGMLTLKTPSGFQWRETEITDDSLNVGYSNLPTIGHISDIDDNGVTINLHMSGFYMAQEWCWPHFYEKTVTTDNGESTITVGEITCKNPGDESAYDKPSEDKRGIHTIKIRHGLFPNNKYPNNLEGKVRCFCNVMAMNSDNDTEYEVQASVDNFTGLIEKTPASSDRRTEITISTPETMRYSITGRVLYNFNKQVIPSNGGND